MRSQTVLYACRLIVLAFLFGLPGVPASAHHVGGESAVTQGPAATAPVESLTGTVADLVIADQVASSSSRYVLLRLDSGDMLALSGSGLSTLPAGARAQAMGRRADGVLFVTETRTVSPAPARAAGQGATQVSGTLFVVHADDFQSGKGTFTYVVRGDDASATPLKLAFRPDELKIGMRVVANGSIAADGFSLEPSRITIIASPAAQQTPTGQATTNNVLVVLIKFSDSPASDPFSQADVQQMMTTGAGSATNYYREVSYGQHLLNATVTPWLKSTSATPANCNYTLVGQLADAAAAAAGYTGSYQNRFYVMPPMSCGWLGLAYVGFPGGLGTMQAWSNGSNSLLVYAHELGHNFGLLHAGSISCGGDAIGGPSCSASEYGDPYVVMGQYGTGHFSAEQKAYLGWIVDGPGGTVRTHTSGTASYALAPLESAGGASYAVKIPATGARNYWVEFRQPIGFDSSVPSGAQVRVTYPFEYASGSDDTEILAVHPGVNWTLDVGESWVDRATGTAVSVVSKDVGPPAALHVNVTKVNLPMRGDFNNDAYGDLMWQSPSTSQAALWFMKTGTMTSSAFFGLPSGWLPQGVGDFNGDGNADIVWTNPGTNQAAIWFMSGASHGTPPDAFFGVPNSWSIAAIGDFNGDGIADILWRNVDGRIATWLMNGGTIQSVIYYNNVDPNWTALGTGDFYGDGKSEILWRYNPNGALYLWRNVDTSTPQIVPLGTPGGSWQVAAIGDFDGDGVSDLFLRDATGANAVWKSGSSASAAFPPAVPTSWSVLTARQLYGDGTSTLIWQRNDGLVAHWRFDSTLASPAASFLSTVPLNWSLVGQ